MSLKQKVDTKNKEIQKLQHENDLLDLTWCDYFNRWLKSKEQLDRIYELAKSKQVENIKIRGILDIVCLIWNRWNRREITSEKALSEMCHYIGREVEGAKKRRELMRSSIPLYKRRDTTE